VLKETYSFASVLFFSEVLKLITASLMVIQKVQRSDKSYIKLLGTPTTGERAGVMMVGKKMPESPEREIELVHAESDTKDSSNSPGGEEKEDLEMADEYAEFNGNNSGGSTSLITLIPGFLTVIKYVFSNSKPMAVAALIYLTMNTLSLFVLGRVEATTTMLFFQFKLVTTAICARFYLGKVFSFTKIRAMACVTLGVIQISVATMPKKNQASGHTEADNIANQKQEAEFAAWVAGMIALITEITLSAAASVYMEAQFKDVNDEVLGLWEKNIQLAAWSMPVYIVMDVWTKGSSFFFNSQDGTVGTVIMNYYLLGGFFAGWSHITLLIAMLNSLGGLAVAMSLKYTDSVLKCLAMSISVIITTWASWKLLNGVMSEYVLLASALVILGVLNYQFAD